MHTKVKLIMPNMSFHQMSAKCHKEPTSWLTAKMRRVCSIKMHDFTHRPSWSKVSDHSYSPDSELKLLCISHHITPETYFQY